MDSVKTPVLASSSSKKRNCPLDVPELVANPLRALATVPWWGQSWITVPAIGQRDSLSLIDYCKGNSLYWMEKILTCKPSLNVEFSESPDFLPLLAPPAPWQWESREMSCASRRRWCRRLFCVDAAQSPPFEKGNDRDVKRNARFTWPSHESSIAMVCTQP